MGDGDGDGDGSSGTGRQNCGNYSYTHTHTVATNKGDDDGDDDDKQYGKRWKLHAREFTFEKLFRQWFWFWSTLRDLIVIICFMQTRAPCWRSALGSMSSRTSGCAMRARPWLKDEKTIRHTVLRVIITIIVYLLAFGNSHTTYATSRCRKTVRAPLAANAHCVCVYAELA